MARLRYHMTKPAHFSRALSLSLSLSLSFSHTRIEAVRRAILDFSLGTIDSSNDNFYDGICLSSGTVKVQLNLPRNILE